MERKSGTSLSTESAPCAHSEVLALPQLDAVKYVAIAYKWQTASACKALNQVSKARNSHILWMWPRGEILYYIGSPVLTQVQAAEIRTSSDEEEKANKQDYKTSRFSLRFEDTDLEGGTLKYNILSV